MKYEATQERKRVLCPLAKEKKETEKNRLMKKR